MTSTAMKSASQTREGRYRLLAEIGHGGMALVHLAVACGPSNFNKLVVVKSLRAALAEDGDFLRMFLDEARLAARLNHPHVVQTYEVVEDAGRHLIVMEYLEGQPLSHIIERSTKAEPSGMLPLRMHLKIISEALEGLHYAHELADFDGTKLELVHRDVSPHNVFVTFDGQVKVVDFGIAKAAGTTSATQTGVVKGKVRYMAPEQMLGEAVDRRADLYAVGVMLWEAAVRRPRWAGMADIAIITAVTNGGGKSPREINPEISEELNRICMKALAIHPSERYQTAAELIVDLENELQTMGTLARQRDVGKLVSDMFADVRAQTKRLIEEQLSKATSLSSSDLVPITLPVGTGTSSLPSDSGSGNVGGSGSHGAHASGSSPQIVPASVEQGRTRRFVAWMGGALVLLVGIALAASWQHVGKSAPILPPVVDAPQPVPPSPARMAAPESPKMVELRVLASPPEAKLFLDDEPLKSNPVAETRPPDERDHALRIEAKGYVPRTIQIALRENQTISLSLDRASKVSAATKSAGAKSGNTGAAPSTSAAAPAKPSCENPYFIDDRGIKVVRQECR